MQFIIRFYSLILIPLIPTTILWAFLNQIPEAKVSGLKFGGLDFSITGSAAAYVVFVILGFKAHKMILSSKADHLLNDESITLNRAKEIEGTWSYDEDVYYTEQAGPQGLERHGNVIISTDAERVLHLHGERIDENENVIQQWRSERVFLLENELIVFFEVPAIQGKAQFSGVARLSLCRNSERKITEMRGSFSALNLPRYGTIRFTRTLEPEAK